jgi:hypothetical protein
MPLELLIDQISDTQGVFGTDGNERKGEGEGS